MIKKDKLVLAANWETYTILKERGIESILWEDCYDKNDLIDLNEHFRKFCNTWYFGEEGEDLSLYDGMSIGSAISMMLYYDLETWIRSFYLFEYLASNKVGCKFYVPDRDYFPEAIYHFLDNINGTYDTSQTIRTLQREKNDLEEKFNDIVAFERNVIKLEERKVSNIISQLDVIKNVFRSKSSKDVRCFIHHIRNLYIYLDLLNNDKTLSDKINIYIDTKYFSPKNLMKFMRYKYIYIVNERVNNLYIEDNYLNNYLSSLCNNANKFISEIDFIGPIGKNYFGRVFIAYIQKALKSQLAMYSHLSKVIKKFKINATICGGHDSPESYYCKHLMDKYGGISFFLPHGIVWKDKNIFKYRESLAHHYFCYSESEKSAWLNNYDIPQQNILPIRFLKKEKRKYKVNERLNETNILILQDIFMASLVSKINVYKSFTKLVSLLKNLGFMKIDFRFNSAMQYLANNREIIDRFYFSLPIQTPTDISLKDVIHKYDIVIGSLSTSVYEALCNSVFYIPYIPDYFPYRTVEKIIESHWFQGLFPAPCTNLEEIKNILLDYIDSPSDTYERFLNSVKKVNIYEEKEVVLWENMARLNK